MSTKLYIKQAGNVDNTLNTEFADLSSYYLGLGFFPNWSYANTIQSVYSTPATSNFLETTSGGTTPVGFEPFSNVTFGGFAWITPPLASAITISGTITFNFWGSIDTPANTGLNCQLYTYPTGVNAETPFISSNNGTNLTTTPTLYNWTGTPTSTSFSVGDRIVIQPCFINVGTMEAGSFPALGYGGNTSGVNGDTWVQFTENISFLTEIEIIQVGIGGGSGTSGTLTMTNSSAAGNTIVVLTSIGTQSATTTISDTVNTYITPSGWGPVNWAPADGDGTDQDQMFYTSDIVGGTTLTITATTSVDSGTDGISIVAIEFAGLTSSPAGAFASTTGTSIQANTPTIIPTSNYSLIVGAIDNYVGGEANSVLQVIIADVMIVSVIESVTSSSFIQTLNSSDAWTGFIGSFVGQGQSINGGATTPFPLVGHT